MPTQPGILGPRKHGCASGSWPCGFSKCPISHEAETFTVCAVQPAQVTGTPPGAIGWDVAYIAWYEYGSPLQVKLTGSQMMCRNPLPESAACPVRLSLLWKCR